MKDEILSRRTVLQGALVLGCGACLPLLVSGCNSKTGSTPASTPAPASPPAMANDSAATAKKVPQTSVQYQQQPKGDQKCGSCVNFIAESKTCKLVDGQINPEGWCVLWMKKG